MSTKALNGSSDSRMNWAVRTLSSARRRGRLGQERLASRKRSSGGRTCDIGLLDGLHLCRRTAVDAEHVVRRLEAARRARAGEAVVDDEVVALLDVERGAVPAEDELLLLEVRLGARLPPQHELQPRRVRPGRRGDGRRGRARQALRGLRLWVRLLRRLGVGEGEEEGEELRERGGGGRGVEDEAREGGDARRDVVEGVQARSRLRVEAVREGVRLDVAERDEAQRRERTHCSGSSMGVDLSFCSSPTTFQNSSSLHALVPLTSIQLSHDGAASSASLTGSAVAAAVSPAAPAAPTSPSRSSHTRRMPSRRTVVSRLARARRMPLRTPLSRTSIERDVHASRRANVSAGVMVPSGAKTGLMPALARRWARCWERGERGSRRNLVEWGCDARKAMRGNSDPGASSSTVSLWGVPESALVVWERARGRTGTA